MFDPPCTRCSFLIFFAACIPRTYLAWYFIVASLRSPGASAFGIWFHHDVHRPSSCTCDGRAHPLGAFRTEELAVLPHLRGRRTCAARRTSFGSGGPLRSHPWQGWEQARRTQLGAHQILAVCRRAAEPTGGTHPRPSGIDSHAACAQRCSFREDEEEDVKTCTRRRHGRRLQRRGVDCAMGTTEINHARRAKRGARIRYGAKEWTVDMQWNVHEAPFVSFHLLRSVRTSCIYCASGAEEGRTRRRFVLGPRLSPSGLHVHDLLVVNDVHLRRRHGFHHHSALFVAVLAVPRATHHFGFLTFVFPLSDDVSQVRRHFLGVRLRHQRTPFQRGGMRTLAEQQEAAHVPAGFQKHGDEAGGRVFFDARGIDERHASVDHGVRDGDGNVVQAHRCRTVVFWKLQRHQRGQQSHVGHVSLVPVAAEHAHVGFDGPSGTSSLHTERFHVQCTRSQHGRL